MVSFKTILRLKMGVEYCLALRVSISMTCLGNMRYLTPPAGLVLVLYLVANNILLLATTTIYELLFWVSSVAKYVYCSNQFHWWVFSAFLWYFTKISFFYRLIPLTSEPTTAWWVVRSAVYTTSTRNTGHCGVISAVFSQILALQRRVSGALCCVWLC